MSSAHPIGDPAELTALYVAGAMTSEEIAAFEAHLADPCERCAAELNALGIPVVPSSTNFLLARVGDAPGVRSALLRRRAAVRDCTSFGLPEYIRIAVRTPEECARFIEVLREVMEHE